MKRRITILLFLFISFVCFSQVSGSGNYEWNPGDDFRYTWVRVDNPDNVPEIWKEYPWANHVFEIHNAWEIETDSGVLVPEFIIWRNDDADSVGVVDACRYTYEFFRKNPDRREYSHPDFLLVVSAVRKE